MGKRNRDLIYKNFADPRSFYFLVTVVKDISRKIETNGMFIF